MKIQELIGLKVEEIRCLNYDVKYEGSIPLQDIDVEFKLSSGEIVPYPYALRYDLAVKDEFSSNLNLLYPQGLFKRLFNPSILLKIKGCKIISIWSIGNGFDEDDYCTEIIGIEFENNNFLVKGEMSPKGTGGGDLFLFNSKEEVLKRYVNGMEQVY